MARIITKGLTQFVYIQALMYCLGKENCLECQFKNDEEVDMYLDCKLFNGRYADNPFGALNSIDMAYEQHIINSGGNCDNCVFKHDVKYMDDCYFTDIINRVGKVVKINKS